MFLQSVRLENIRAIKSMEIPFVREGGATRKWTIMLGENGTGKTTILRAIGLLMAGSEALPELVGDPGDWVRKGATEGKISGVLVTADGEEREIGLTLRAGQTAKTLRSENAASLEPLDAAIGHTTRNYLTLGYGNNRRVAAKATKRSGYQSPRARSMATLFDPSAELISVVDWATDLKPGRAREAVALVKYAIDGLMPDVTFHEFDRAGGRLMFKTPDGIIPLEFLGDGYRNLIAMCGDLLHQISTIFNDYKSPLSTRGLLLVDEIDMHLHPRWQRKLLKFLGSTLPKLQLVVTTYSPLTVQQAGEGELIYFKRGGKGQGVIMHHYEAAPNKLKIDQLIVSPVFGLDTGNSRMHEEMQTRYKRLKAKKGKSDAEKVTTQSLKQKLVELPDWAAPSVADQQLNQLLKSIEKKLTPEMMQKVAAAGAALKTKASAKKPKPKPKPRKSSRKKVAKKAVKAKRRPKKKTVSKRKRGR